VTNALGINDRGQMVGRYDAGGISHGFLRDEGDYTTIDHPDAISTPFGGIGLNNFAQIVGQYRDAGGATHGSLATPIKH
jgi:hypothetical protein